jgi:hypothetical protein
MKKQTEQDLRGQIDRLLRQQATFLESRRFGTATEAELREYEVRHDLMRELWEKLVLYRSVDYALCGMNLDPSAVFP